MNSNPLTCVRLSNGFRGNSSCLVAKGLVIVEAEHFDGITAYPRLCMGWQRVVEAAEVTPHPHDKQNVGPPARDGW